MTVSETKPDVDKTLAWLRRGPASTRDHLEFARMREAAIATIEHLTAALSEQAGGCQDISTAPRDGTNFLAAQAGNGSANDTPWWVLFWNGDAFECVSSGRVIPTATKIVGGVTNWRPLPDPPPSSTAGEPQSG